MKQSELYKIILEAVDETSKECPAATQDVSLNTANRDRAIQADFIKYGPLNVEEPGDYWEKIAKKWDTDVKAAFKSRCANCVAFDISPRMLECIPGSVSEPVNEPGAQEEIDDAFEDKPEVGALVKKGVLGYCWMHLFKCHSARACNTWAAGGPINKDKDSYDWQKRNLKGALDPEPLDPDLYKDDTEGEESKKEKEMELEPVAEKIGFSRPDYKDEAINALKDFAEAGEIIKQQLKDKVFQDDDPLVQKIFTLLDEETSGDLYELTQEVIDLISELPDKEEPKKIGFREDLINEISSKNENLRNWFKKEKWVRIKSDGSIGGKCGTSKNKKNPDRCLPYAKAKSLSKKERAATARKKKRGSKGGKKQFVKNTKKAKVRKK